MAKERMGSHHPSFRKGKKGVSKPFPGKPGEPKGQRLMTRIRDMLRERSVSEDGKYNTRFDDCANAFVKAMENGSFVHLKEFIDREEGRVATRVADANGEVLKLYVGMPTDEDPEAP